MKWQLIPFEGLDADTKAARMGAIRSYAQRYEQTPVPAAMPPGPAALPASTAPSLATCPICSRQGRAIKTKANETFYKCNDPECYMSTPNGRKQTTWDARNWDLRHRAGAA